MKSPLLIGTNVGFNLFAYLGLYHDIDSSMKLSAITQETLGILTNKEIIAINQDPEVGQSITPFRWGINVRLWRPST